MKSFYYILGVDRIQPFKEPDPCYIILLPMLNTYRVNKVFSHFHGHGNKKPIDHDFYFRVVMEDRRKIKYECNC